MIKCRNCGFENPDEEKICQSCGLVLLSLREPLSHLATGSSGIVTTPTFSTIVKTIKEPTQKVDWQTLEESVAPDGIRLLIGLGYIRKTSDSKYELTEKGISAYYENKVFREEVNKAKEIIKKRLKGSDSNE